MFSPRLETHESVQHGCGAHSVSTATLQTVVAKPIVSHLYHVNAAVIDTFCLKLLLGERGASRVVMGVQLHTATLLWW
jgi:hypothetical protein